MTVQPRPTLIYRHYDACGCLLYIGITYDVRARASQHKADSWWHKWSARVDVERVTYVSRQAAAAAEAEAIERERPPFNTMHATNPDEAAVRYLIDHKRWEHLISPNGATTATAKESVILGLPANKLFTVRYTEQPQEHEADWNDPILLRFIMKYEREPGPNGCCLWRGQIRPDRGTGVFHHPQTRDAHRAAWLIFRGPIPDGHVVRQSCGVRTCVNHFHLHTVPASFRSVEQILAACRRNHPGVRPRWGKLASGTRYCRECSRVGAGRRRRAQS